MITTVIERASCKWLDVIQPTPEEIQQIAETYNIHHHAIQDCLEPEHLPKYEKLDQVHFFIVRAYDAKAPADGTNVRELTFKIAIFLGTTFIITIHRQDAPFLQTLREQCHKTAPRQADHLVFYIFSELINSTLESYEKPIFQAENQIETFETHLFLHETTPLNLRDLYLLRRRSTVFFKMFHFLRGIVNEFEVTSKYQQPILQNLREEAEHLLFTSDQLVENINNLLNLYLSLQSHRTNEIVRVLTIFSVFFMPLTLIAGIYGMNFRYMPELEHPYGYAGSLVIMGLIAAGLWAWFKRKGFL